MTIKQIAEKAGTSRGTVDRVLNGRGNVNPELAKRILDIAERERYQPNQLAQALIRSRQRTHIGMVIPSVGNPFFDEVLRGAQSRARKLSSYGTTLTIREIKGYVTWGILILLILLAGAYALQRWLASRGKGFGDLFKPAPPLPPHVAAIQALEALHNQKLWQNNRHKQYYSGLTDILRTYIAGRWGLGAMEMTSDEIIETMRQEELPDKARMDLTAILRDADLVKFAKATPEAEQNEADYLKAYYFVEETKVAEESPAETEDSPAIKNEK